MSVELPADSALREHLAPGMRVEVSGPSWPAEEISCYGATVRTDYEGGSGSKPDPSAGMDVWHNVLTLGYLSVTLPRTLDILGIPEDEALMAKELMFEELAPVSTTPKLKRFESVFHAAFTTGLFTVIPNPDFDLSVQPDDPYDRDKLLTAASLLAVSGGAQYLLTKYARASTEMYKIDRFYRLIRKENGIPRRFGIVLFGHATGRIPKLTSIHELRELMPEDILIDLPELD